MLCIKFFTARRNFLLPQKRITLLKMHANKKYLATGKYLSKGKSQCAMLRTFEQVKDFHEFPEDDDEDLFYYWFLHAKKNLPHNAEDEFNAKYFARAAIIRDKLAERDGSHGIWLTALNDRVEQRSIAAQNERDRLYMYACLTELKSFAETLLAEKNIDRLRDTFRAYEERTQIFAQIQLNRDLMIALHKNKIKQYDMLADAVASAISASNYTCYLTTLKKYVIFENYEIFTKFTQNIKSHDTQIFEVVSQDESRRIRLFASGNNKFQHQIENSLEQFNSEHKNCVHPIFGHLIFNKEMSRYEFLFNGYYVNSQDQCTKFMEYFARYIDKSYEKLSEHMQLRTVSEDLKHLNYANYQFNNIPFAENIDTKYEIHDLSALLLSKPIEPCAQTIASLEKIEDARPDAFAEFIKYLSHLQNKPRWYTPAIAKDVLYDKFNKFVQKNCKPDKYDNTQLVKPRTNAAKKFCAFMQNKLFRNECREHGTRSFEMIPFGELKSQSIVAEFDGKTNTAPQYIYLLQTRECRRVEGENNIFKIGRTTQIGSRFQSYPKESVVKFCIQVPDCISCERELINIFDKEFERAQLPSGEYYGREYYRGDCEKMVDTITQHVSLSQ